MSHAARTATAAYPEALQAGRRDMASPQSSTPTRARAGTADVPRHRAHVSRRRGTMEKAAKRTDCAVHPGGIAEGTADLRCGAWGVGRPCVAGSPHLEKREEHMSSEKTRPISVPITIRCHVSHCSCMTRIRAHRHEAGTYGVSGSICHHCHHPYDVHEVIGETPSAADQGVSKRGGRLW